MGVLTRGSRIKGLISGGLGLLISLIGLQAVTGVPRFSFGHVYFYEGVALIPFTLGVFAIPEMVTLAAKGGTIAGGNVVIKGMHDVWEGARDVFRHWNIWLRSTLLGYVLGIIPGIGAMAATFLAYGQAKQMSKHPERYGTGIVEGVIAPESANNAKEAGALLTTLALGIPGSADMAILLGAFLILGLIPGPEMMTTHLDLSFTLFLVIIAANILAILICFPAAMYLAKVAAIPVRILAPIVLIITFIGIFAYREMFNDVAVALVCSILGLAMKRFDFNSVAMVLGYILGKQFEYYLFTALAVSGPLFFMRPISLSLIAIIIGLFVYKPLMNLFHKWRGVKAA
jgi:TctA family transporter